jgi:hypothetical protein
MYHLTGKHAKFAIDSPQFVRIAQGTQRQNIDPVLFAPLLKTSAYFMVKGF